VLIEGRDWLVRMSDCVFDGALYPVSLRDGRDVRGKGTAQSVQYIAGFRTPMIDNTVLFNFRRRPAGPIEVSSMLSVQKRRLKVPSPGRTATLMWR
jgi:hypothetical protein